MPGKIGSSRVKKAFQTDISRHIWRTKYRLTNGPEGPEQSLAETWDRVAGTLAAVEPWASEAWRARFRAALEGFRFLPKGAILEAGPEEARHCCRLEQGTP